ncbi:DUF3095 family protein [Christiangramia sabulilitoris]|uniref:DUF3095 domain-containing protein n=1 Tax=Christiangramia sabulilitoris TaxID=2583991 RepID=A0A550I947_9FLAO|nr:DUF3095 family protein [Christiangramia sabulilitoris]TRO67507.1 DUF3095 domain-containing protein [Christiangramia sabulilitoris]
MKATNTNFFSDLQVQDIAISSLISQREMFTEIPGDWHILVADIRNSTQAVQNGKHHQVNLVATGCVVAVLNLADANDINVPFFFGGDGATFLIPEVIREKSLAALKKHHKNAEKNFGFNLSIGSVSVSDIYSENVDLKIARVKANHVLNIPVVLGYGLQYAEDRIKHNGIVQDIVVDETPLNLDGMECKWDKIKPPDSDQEVLSLIVTGCGETDYSSRYSKVMMAIDEIYGSADHRKPISVQRLKIKAGLQRIKDEMKTKLGRWDLGTFIKSFMIANFGELYLRNTSAGKSYLQKLVELSDNLTLDGRINTVITGNSKQRKRLIRYLDMLEQKGLIKYGYHVSGESIMSCYVKDMSTDQHIHFVDGGNGGYTKAANHLKAKFHN